MVRDILMVLVSGMVNVCAIWWDLIMTQGQIKQEEIPAVSV